MATKIPTSAKEELPTWADKRREVINAVGHNTKTRDYAKANAEAIERAVAGQDPHHQTTDSKVGARMVCNISAAHVPAFVAASSDGDPKAYKNGYDLGYYRVGGKPGHPLQVRELVDADLPLNGFGPDNLYFGAVELNGSGIRFFGDICLVLKSNELGGETTVLDRNSFEVVQSPLLEEIAQLAATGTNRREYIEHRLSGKWSQDLRLMATVKVLPEFGAMERRLTTARISDVVLHDENYMEVLRQGSFSLEQLQETRTSAADASYEAHIAERLRHGPLPSLEGILWRDRRRRAEAALRGKNCLTRVVTTTGRIR
jgi:hypothetical protein